MTSIKRSTTLSLACGALLALALGSVAFATHARVGGGTPFRAPLVVAYNQCGGAPTAEDPAPSVATNTHVTPLAFPSCVPQAQKRNGANPPTLTTTTTGTANGSVRLDVICDDGALPPCPAAGQQENVRIAASSIVGVLCNIAGGGAPPTFQGACSAPGAGYNGILLAQSVIRITDHSNAASPNDICAAGTGAAPCATGTVQDTTFTVPMVCGSFAALPAGTCGPAATTINGLLAGAVKDLQRGNVEITNIRVMSPGNDFILGPAPFPGTGDEDKFMSQGIFLP
jgi:hypothetical protein